MNHKKTTRFPDLTAAAKFYGIGRALLFNLRSLGKEHDDTLPVDDPGQMPAWFERMQARGTRRHGCPDSVMQRAVEATTATAAPGGKRKTATATKSAPAAATVKAKGGKAAAAPAAPPAKATAAPAAAPVRLTLSNEGSDLESISTRNRRLHAAMATRYEQYIVDGEQEALPAVALYKRMMETEDRIIKLAKNAHVFRAEGEWLHATEVQAAAAEFANGVYLILRRELTAGLQPADYERVMAALDTLGDTMPTLLAAQFPDGVKAAAS